MRMEVGQPVETNYEHPSDRNGSLRNVGLETYSKGRADKIYG